MVRSSMTRRTTDGTTGAAAMEIIAGPKGCFLRTLGLYLVAATASVYQVGRPTAKGITPGGVASLFNEGDPLGAPTASTGNSPTTTALSWGTGPTSPSRFLKAASLPAAVGASVIWTWANLFIPFGSTVVLWNSSGNSLVDVFVEVDENVL